MLPQINIFGISFSTYWSMLFIGVLGMAVICLNRSNRYCHSETLAATRAKAIVFTVALTIFGLLGTKLLYILENLEETLENGISLGGQSFFGALFLVPGAVAVFGYALKMRPLESTDYCAPPVIFILMCMRLGCFMNGCCGGIEIGAVRVPVQIIEAVGDAAIFSFLLYIESRTDKKGILYPCLMGSYGIMRFFLEFLRDTEKNILLFSRGQIFSVISIIVSVIWIARLAHEKKQ